MTTIVDLILSLPAETKAAWPTLSTTEQLEILNEPVPEAETVSRYFINKRTFLDLFGSARTTTVMDKVKTLDPLVWELLSQLGDNSGNSGGADIGCATGQAMLMQMAAAIPLTSEEVSALRSLCTTQRGKHEVETGRPACEADLFEAEKEMQDAGLL